jgi:hypothetical protein
MTRDMYNLWKKTFTLAPLVPLGICKLGCSKITKVLIPKVHIVTLKWKKHFKTNIDWAICGD